MNNNRQIIFRKRTPLFIDTQGFVLKYDNDEEHYIVKELAILKPDDTIAHFVFEAPFRRTFLSSDNKHICNDTTATQHGISWTTGYVPYYKLKTILRRHVPRDEGVYWRWSTTGQYLQKWLKCSYFNLDDLPHDITSKCTFSNQRTCCHHQQQIHECALENVYKYLNIYCTINNLQMEIKENFTYSLLVCIIHLLQNVLLI